MKFIGITGGVGAGKSTVLDLLTSNLNCKIIKADELAAQLMSPGHACFDEVVALSWGQSILDEKGEIDRPLMARLMYDSTELREAVNEIVHPAVKKEALNQVDEARKNHNIEYFFLEAALLLEDGYDKLCDEIWYIFAEANVRRDRLRASRGYSDAKIDSIMAVQKADDEFRAACQFTIDNSFDKENTLQQIMRYLTNN